MNLPSLLYYDTEAEYKQHYIDNYCNLCPISTFDGVPVMFYEDQFAHAFYHRTHKSWKAKKDKFSTDRGERMEWIKHTLMNPHIIPKKGYDKEKNCYDNTRRVSFLSEENYLVVIYVNNRGVGKFVTAYLVDNELTAEKIRKSPRWER